MSDSKDKRIIDLQERIYRLTEEGKDLEKDRQRLQKENFFLLAQVKKANPEAVKNVNSLIEGILEMEKTNSSTRTDKDNK